MDPKIDYELAVAVAELSEAQDFLMEISKLSPKEMFEAVRKRDPAFIEHCEAMEEPPESPLDFWEGFGIWSIRCLGHKYRHIWEKVVDAYFVSPAHDRKMRDAEVWSDIEEILKESTQE